MLLVSQTCYCSIVVCLRQYITQNMWPKTQLQVQKKGYTYTYVFMYICMYEHVFFLRFYAAFSIIYSYGKSKLCSALHKWSIDNLFLKYINVSCCTKQNEKPVQKWYPFCLQEFYEDKQNVFLVYNFCKMCYKVFWIVERLWNGCWYDFQPYSSLCIMHDDIKIWSSTWITLNL